MATERVEAVGREIRRLLGEFRVGRAYLGGPGAPKRPMPNWLAVAPQSVEGLAHALAEAARAATALALRNRVTATTSVTGISQGTDRMLFGLTVTPESATGRASAGDIPVVAPTLVELFGYSPGDRRRYRISVTRRRGGIGALVVLGYRADRRALERTLAAWAGELCSMACVDIDHFKRFNDWYGHVAGDAALRHVARVFSQTLRENDLAARIGGEEFALWLPETPLRRALDAGQRVRRRVESSVVHWDGRDLSLACSVGVASVPDSVGSGGQPLRAADAALYQAKRGGRNRVAQPSTNRTPVA